MTKAATVRATIAAVRNDGPLVRVSVVRADGSTPREAGAAMLVSAYGCENTIGGGTLELEAIRRARTLLGQQNELGIWHRETCDFALGPSLGQCCGGATRLLFEIWTPREADAIGGEAETGPADSLVLRPLVAGAAPVLLASRKQEAPAIPMPVMRVARDMLSGVRPRAAALVPLGRGAPAWFIEPTDRALVPLYLYGAGHVGRAIVHVLNGLPFAIHWVDTAPDRFPTPPSADIRVIPAADPASVAATAPASAFHLVLTFSHALDLAIVHALLQRADAAFVGLIGSETKAARFRKRLREAGIPDAAIGRLTCPIGINGLDGKEPPVIAVSVAAQLIGLLEQHAIALSASGAQGA